MANRVSSLLSGVGTLGHVSNQLACDEESSVAQDIIGSWATVVKDATKPCGRLDRRFIALVAAALNADLLASGYLYRAGTDGRLERDFFATDSQRELIASMMAD